MTSEVEKCDDQPVFDLKFQQEVSMVGVRKDYLDKLKAVAKAAREYLHDIDAPVLNEPTIYQYEPGEDKSWRLRKALAALEEEVNKMKERPLFVFRIPLVTARRDKEGIAVDFSPCGIQHLGYLMREESFRQVFLPCNEAAKRMLESNDKDEALKKLKEAVKGAQDALEELERSLQKR